MGTIKLILEQFRVIALLMAGVLLLALAGCGDSKSATSAPFGSTITVAQFGSAINSGPVTTFAKDTLTKTQNYRITVLDEADQPLDGIRVDLLGQFTNGVKIAFGGAFGASSPVTLQTFDQTSNGILMFSITAPYYAQGTQLSFPINQNAVPSATGGNLGDGTYSYQITTLDFAGETTPGGAISATVTNATPTTLTGSVALSWSAVPGATSYNVYGALNPGAIGYLVTIICPCSNPVTLTDTGIYYPQGAAPPGANTTGLSLNSIIGTMQATSGAAIATHAIDF